jgi:hypothetical protein
MQFDAVRVARSRRGGVLKLAKNASPFLSFSYVCPEPVLVK